ncbi:hypothetical protein HNQ65_001782 [Prosthecobacter vanneervenii]|uniref:Uncharacterized protein n=1 Tax=Prosthecobacter vanneervenii TaxID=48466 RepID=A0A7W7YAD1_9BACT|nr:hypothetical protein [Prosthecobacter vanneervenii]
MYCILETASEACAAFRKAADTRAEDFAGMETEPGFQSHRSHLAPSVVCLTPNPVCWDCPEIAELRWTSLSA